MPIWTKSDLERHLDVDPSDPEDSERLRSYCHPTAAAIVKLHTNNVIELRCKVCNAQIAAIAVHRGVSTPVVASSIILRNTCHKTKGIAPVYGNGTLAIACAGCNSLLEQFAVADSPAAGGMADPSAIP
jgi:hypothetical protein